jgi:hypothetical protein
MRRGLIYKYLLLLLTGMMIISCRGKRSVTDSMVGSKPERSIWSRWKMKRERKNNSAYNPYIEMKKKDKPSSIQAKENKKIIRKAKRAVRKEKRKLRRQGKGYKK